MDRPAAQRWFRAAAERGHAHAQMMLGRYLARALAGERNSDEARVWLERALAQGLTDAESDLASLPPAAAAPAVAAPASSGPPASAASAAPATAPLGREMAEN
jgi:TPR repeat protein